jgi:hypothetical protein
VKTVSHVSQAIVLGASAFLANLLEGKLMHLSEDIYKYLQNIGFNPSLLNDIRNEQSQNKENGTVQRLNEQVLSLQLLVSSLQKEKKALLKKEVDFSLFKNMMRVQKELGEKYREILSKHKESTNERNALKEVEENVDSSIEVLEKIVSIDEKLVKSKSCDNAEMSSMRVQRDSLIESAVLHQKALDLAIQKCNLLSVSPLTFE